MCARQTFLIGLKKSPAAPPLSSTSQVKSTFLSEANLWFIASRLNNSTITITFVVIYKLCATQQKGWSVCVGVGERCVSLSFIEGLFVLLPSCSCF